MTRRALTILGLILISAPALAQQSLTFAWDASPVDPLYPATAGYSIELGPAPGATAQRYDVGPALTTTLTLDPGTIYVRVWAYAASGAQSPTSSNELRVVVGGPAPCAFTVAPTSASAPATGGPGQVTVTASAPTCTWSAASNSPWIDVGALSGVGTGTLGYTVQPNTGAARTGSLAVATGTVTVAQAAAAPPADPCVDSPFKPGIVAWPATKRDPLNYKPNYPATYRYSSTHGSTVMEITFTETSRSCPAVKVPKP